MGGGINIGYGTDMSKPFLGAKAHYDITDAFTVAAKIGRASCRERVCLYV